jgi:hypothetical protein
MFSYSCAAEHLFGLWTFRRTAISTNIYIFEIAEKSPQQFEGNMRMSVVNAVAHKRVSNHHLHHE